MQPGPKISLLAELAVQLLLLSEGGLLLSEGGGGGGGGGGGVGVPGLTALHPLRRMRCGVN